jgi:hypothetical protein
MAAVAGVILLCLSSSAAGYLFTRGEDEKPKKSPTSPSTTSTGPSTTPTGPSTTSTGPTGPSTTSTSPTAFEPGDINGYTKFANFNIQSEDENCVTDSNINACKTKCDYNDDCVSFTVSKDNKCCVNTDSSGIAYDEDTYTYVKSPEGYSVERLGDKDGGLISSDDTSDFNTCIDKCSDTIDCVGISYKKGVCDLKKSEGMASSYSQTSKQFILNESPKSPAPVNCVLGEKIYESCDKGRGKKSWKKSVVTPAAHGGTACGPTTGEDNCRVNCEGSWGGWGNCSKECGGGVKTRSFRVTHTPKHGGSACPSSPQQQNCNTQACGPSPEEIAASLRAQTARAAASLASAFGASSSGGGGGRAGGGGGQ